MSIWLKISSIEDFSKIYYKKIPIVFIIVGLLLLSKSWEKYKRKGDYITNFTLFDSL